MNEHPRAVDDVKDMSYMSEALTLARFAKGSTSPNPVVGAVIVRDGRTVGMGRHERYGAAHAEVNALAQAGDLARGATVYVTLEPCCVWSNTPPCTDALIAAGVARVVAATEDPNPDVAGRGIRILRDAGIQVDVGVLREHAVQLNAPYIKFRRTGLAHVVLKLAMSLDGRITPPGRPEWVSCPASRRGVHAMRGESDCVMVGIGTVVADDPLLTDRREGEGSTDRQPARLVVDRNLRTPLDSALVETAREIETIVACTAAADAEREAALAKRGVTVWRCAESASGVDLREVLSRLAAHGKLAVLCEGGSHLASSLLSEGLADRVAFFVAPRIFGPECVPAFSGLDDDWWVGSRRLSDVSWTGINGDVLLEANVVTGDDDSSDGEETCSPDS
jgi:diaminohydroxyphosphoribosylaminopyrimidine deaminase/5-amino-6-(5-phosphoribosylamino)uracil reductase